MRFRFVSEVFQVRFRSVSVAFGHGHKHGHGHQTPDKDTDTRHRNKAVKAVDALSLTTPNFLKHRDLGSQHFVT